MPIPNAYHRLENSLREPSAASKRIGPVDPEESLPITITVRRRPGSPSLPDQEHWASTPPGERRYLSTEEFAESYGADLEDLELVATFVREHGLTVVAYRARVGYGSQAEQRIRRGVGPLRDRSHHRETAPATPPA
jgi:hypothetical protein